MELIVMLLVPLPLGLLIRHRLAAFVAYIAVHSFVFTFQSLSLLLEWEGGDTSAFGKDPGTPWSYGIVNALIFAVGLGLVALGHWLRNRKRSRATDPVDIAA